MLTPEQLAEIRERWAKATPILRGMTEMGISGILWTLFSAYENRVASVVRREDALCFQHAKSDIDNLLAEVRRLNRQNTEQKKVVDATFLYMKNINSPLCIGWDNLLDAMQSYRKYLESEVGNNG